MHIVLIGPHIDAQLVATTARLPADNNLPALEISYVSELYHEFARKAAATAAVGAEEKKDDEEQETKVASPKDLSLLPCAIFCFNAGMWGFEEWEPTIKYVTSVCFTLIVGHNRGACWRT